MRCPVCGRKAKRLRTARGPDGRLRFDWCSDCIADIHSDALGLPGRVSIQAHGPHQAIPLDVPLPPPRAVTLRRVSIALVGWAVVLVAVGALQRNRLPVFAAWACVLLIGGISVGLASIESRRQRIWIARAIEAAALGLGTGVLLFGIMFHDNKRDTWIVAVVSLAALAIWAARSWSGRRETTARPLA